MARRFGLLCAAAAMALATGAAAQTGAMRPAPLSELTRSVRIPHEQFTLDNGLRVIVHTDRKTPVVAVSVWYNVGSRDEPPGKTGFAHLFEHLMFNGSENSPGEFFEPLENVGATDYNGTTWFDRTNYFQNVPTPALELALFLESDRMGHLLGAVTQENLSNQIGVVQNEKRQGDNEPYGLVEYAVLEGLFPEGHPYRHSTIGSMADLSAASLETVQTWFRTNYGPNNAVLVLAGDIDARTARPLVEKYFGKIPRGPTPPKIAGGVPERSAPTRVTLKDQVANARLYRIWAVPGRTDERAQALDVALTVLGGGNTSRLYNDLVRDKKLAVAVRGYVQEQQLASFAQLEVDVRPGVDPAVVEARIDELLAEFLRTGPTQDEVQRVATRAVSGTVRGLEAVGGFGGKAVTLAEGALYANDPDFFRKQLDRYAAATPASVQEVSRQWLNDGELRLAVLPGDRPADESAASTASSAGGSAGGGADQQTPTPQPASPTTATDAVPPAGSQPQPTTTPTPPVGQPPAQAQAASAPATPAARRSTRAEPLPEVRGTPELDFPDVERTTLANGLEVRFARRTTVPVVDMMLSFDAGIASDRRDRQGLASLTAALLDEGTARRTAVQVAEEAERLGASLSASVGVDRTRISLSALKPNLAASLDLYADVLRNPAFAQGEIDRLRTVQLSRIQQELTEPAQLARREMGGLLFGAEHPYGQPLTGSGTIEGVTAATREDVAAYAATWLRPDNATLFVVGDTTLAELKPLLERALGDWRPSAAAKGVKRFPAQLTAGTGRIVILDRPNSPQSYIYGGLPLPIRGTDDPLTLRAANEVIGGAFTSRLNMNLREDKGWSYGTFSSPTNVREQLFYQVIAPVQTDRTADSLKAIIDDVRAFQGDKPTTPAELSRMINANTRSLPGDYETQAAVLQAMENNAVLGRPDDYQERLAARYRAFTSPQLGEAARVVDPSKTTWVIVGDRARIEPGLRALNLGPVEVRPAPTPAG